MCVTGTTEEGIEHNFSQMVTKCHVSHVIEELLTEKGAQKSSVMLRFESDKVFLDRQVKAFVPKSFQC